MIENDLIGVYNNSIGELTGDELLQTYDEIWIYRNYIKYICIKVGYIVDLKHMTYAVHRIDPASGSVKKYFIQYHVLEYLNNSTLDFRNYVVSEDLNKAV